jgi:hypothetical protein
VIGDLMRDSLGNPSPVSITAFGANGEAISGETITYVALDPSVTIDETGTIRGVAKDTVGGRIVAGAGGLQTPPARVIVTIAPTAVTKSDAATPIQFVNTEPDTSKSTNWSDPLVVTVKGGTVPAQGYIVTYSLIETPDAEVAGTPTAYIGDDTARPSARDTTNSKGESSRRVILRQSAVATSTRS